tara:strand:- start:2288 stop:4153 length:1866 start_codon:yes stop_codon:yes gene_type:complete
MPSVEDKEKVLSDYYKFWMNVKYNLGFSSAKNWKKPPSPYNSCEGGYSDNETLHDSGKCKKERFVNLARKQNQGWSSSDWFQFVFFCSLPIVTTLIMYALFANNIMQYGLALRNYKKLMYHKDKELNKLEVEFEGNQHGFKEAVLKLNEKILERAKVIGITKFDNEAGDLPYWYSPDMNQCSQPVDGCKNVQTWTECHKFKNKIEWEAELWKNLSGLGSTEPETAAEQKKDIAERNKEVQHCDYTLPQSTWWVNEMTRKVMAKAKIINMQMNSPQWSPEKGYPGIANFPVGAPKADGPPIGMFSFFSWWFMQKIWGPLARLRRNVLAFFCTILITAPDPMDPKYVEKINKPSIIEGLKFIFVPTLIAPIMSFYLAMETAVSPIYILSQLLGRSFYAWPFTPMMPFDKELNRTINLISFRWTLAGVTRLFTSKSMWQIICWLFICLPILFAFSFAGYSITLMWDMVSFIFFLIFGPWAAPPVPPEGEWEHNKRPGITGWSDFSNNRRFLFLYKYRAFIILMFIWGILYGPGKMYLDDKSVQAGLVVFIIFAWQMLSRMFSIQDDKEKDGKDGKKGDDKDKKEQGGMFSKMTDMMKGMTKGKKKGGDAEPSDTSTAKAATPTK